ncbi:DNA-binding MurR/RpiR family transcriptional regulator [Hydrogenophaga palleronii]|uniref:DNA-binding MurR/RpiR family transcriptional regulator n=1 Tax=Hydrogenophaga palleronii TaxID=65655 RepID=A0ABU1WN07_9BURK|nr:MurR/RpiR family transcriptional regulator [Hydrogenophaga palleronii]MDR7150681.1 DNA-binding MurR/RpiR family transcriptional regulator [Hydrogenophaga palleronii]
MTRATTFEAFADAVSEAFPRLSKQQQQIARFVLENPDDLALGTVATVAEATAVQPSALIRFANTLGFAGFTDMQQLFRARLLDRVGTYRDRIESIRRSNGSGAPEAGVLHQFVSNGMADLGTLEDNVKPAELNEAAGLISRARRVQVLAQRRAFPVACYLAYALSQLDIKAQLMDGVGGMLADTLRQMEPGELLLVTSFKNYSQDVVKAAEDARARGITVVAITDFALSPLKPHAHLCFELGQGPDANFRSLVAPLCLAQALVVATGHQLAKTPTTRRQGASPKGAAAADSGRTVRKQGAKK